MLLNHLSTGDLTVVSAKIKMNGGVRTTILASCYMSFEQNILPPSDELINLVRYCKSNSLPLLLGCDANSHHTVWGSTDTNAKGESLLEFILTSDLIVLNKGKDPTFYNSVRKEVLDLTLTSISFAHIIKNWRVSNEILTSDHECIRFHIDWDSFKEIVRMSVPLVSSPIDSIATLEEVAEKLSQCLTNGYYGACPSKTIKQFRSAPFFTFTLKSLRTETRKAFNRAKDKDPLKIAIRRMAQKFYSKVLRRTKRTKLQQLYNSINTITGASSAFKSLSKDPICAIGSLKKTNGSFTGTTEATLLHLLETHFPNCVIAENQLDAEVPSPFFFY